MTKPIKVAYNWIGPDGPITNTEPPNLLRLTYQTPFEHGPDDVWYRVLSHDTDFELTSAYSLSKNDTFIYPFTLTWRTEFNQYFPYKQGLFEHSMTPEHVIEYVKEGNGYILLDMPVEPLSEQHHLDAICSYFSNYGIPLSKIIYITATINPIEEKRIKLLPYAMGLYALSGGTIDYNTEIVPEKLLLCFNRRMHTHRRLLAIMLNKEGLVDRSYYSMGRHDPEYTPFKFESYIEDILPSSLTMDDVQKMVDKLPLNVDNITFPLDMCKPGEKSYYENSLLSLVTETTFDKDTIRMTEKIGKVIARKHPFIIAGAKGTLSKLHELGFKTFSDFWDESYDNLEPNDRMLKIVEICKEISTWDDNKILEFKRNAKPILEHNYIVMCNLKNYYAEKIKNFCNVTIG